jgi:hypothetical protein
MKPPTVSDMVKKIYMSNLPAGGVSTSNRFEALASDEEGMRRGRKNRLDSFSTLDSRSRSVSQKRKAEETGELTGAIPKKSLLDKGKYLHPSSHTGYGDHGTTEGVGSMSALEKNIIRMRELVTKVSTEVATLDDEGPVKSVLQMVCEFMETTTKVQESLANRQITNQVHQADFDWPELGRNKDSVPTYAKAASREQGDKQYRNSGKGRLPPSKKKEYTDYDTESDCEGELETPKIRAFKKAVKEAEKSTLIFNLDMGKVQLLNQTTMCNKATMALAGLAGKVEDCESPCQETIEAIDEVIGAVKNVKIFGKSTKPYHNPANPNDPKNGSFCTVPVRYDFPDKKVRECAETILRDKCKAQCSTPYPVILRACIRKLVKHVKTEYPEDFVKVTVIPNKLGLKVARRTGSGENKGMWFNYEKLVGLPNEVLDVSTFKAPDLSKLELSNLPGRVYGNDRMSTGSQSSPKGGADGAG